MRPWQYLANSLNMSRLGFTAYRTPQRVSTAGLCRPGLAVHAYGMLTRSSRGSWSHALSVSHGGSAGSSECVVTTENDSVPSSPYRRCTFTPTEPSVLYTAMSAADPATAKGCPSSSTAS